MTINEIISRYNAAEETEKSAIMKELETALKDQNATLKKSAISTLLSTADKDGLAAFWMAYLATPNYTALGMRENAETGELETVERVRPVYLDELEKAWDAMHDGQTLARAKNYSRMMAHFIKNVVRHQAGDLSEHDKGEKCAIVTVKKFRGDELETQEVDFSGVSVGALLKQLRTIVETILPEGMAPNMLKADVRAILMAAQTSKELDFKGKKERAMLRLVLDAAQKRITGEAYTYESAAKCFKEPKPKMANEQQSAKTEEKMSKVPERPEAAKTLGKKGKADTITEVA